MTIAPEQRARRIVDERLHAAGRDVQDARLPNLFAATGVAIREEQSGDGPADYLRVVDGLAVGILEAKRAGTPLSGAMQQADRYASGASPSSLPPGARAGCSAPPTTWSNWAGSGQMPCPTSPSPCISAWWKRWGYANKFL